MTLDHSVRHTENIVKKNGVYHYFLWNSIKITIQTFFNIFSLLHAAVTMDKPLKICRALPQCYNCQSLEHTKSYCSHHPRCVMRGEDHSSEVCTKGRKFPAEFALCTENHTTSFKGCPTYKRYLLKRPIFSGFGFSYDVLYCILLCCYHYRNEYFNNIKI